ncbi:MAG: hypothetical protein AAFN07_12360 [Pseudomonadota bacterium]
MSDNPFATPESQTDEPETIPVATHAQILTAGLLGGPVAGFWLLVMNYRACANSAPLVFAAIVGAALSLGLIAVMIIAPSNLPGGFVWLLNLVLLAVWLNYGPPYLEQTTEPHHATLVESGWARPIGVILVSIFWMLPLAVALSFIVLPRA